MKHIRHIYAEENSGIMKTRNELSKVEASIIQKAQESGDIRNSAAPYALIRVSKTLFLGTLAMWTSMSGEFDFEKTMRAGLEICFDVKPEIRQSDECYLRLPEN